MSVRQSEGGQLGGNLGASDRGTSHQFPTFTLLSHGKERWATTSGVIDTACARTLAGARWLEEFEVELKRHATLVEVLPDNETFRFGPGAVKKSSRAVIFPVVVGPNVFILRASHLDEEVPLLISMGVVKQLKSVIDVAEMFQNVMVLLGVVAGHLTMDILPKRASALQKQVMPQMWEQARQGQEVTILRPSSENVGSVLSAITHLLPRLPHRKRSLIITKLTQVTVKRMFRVVKFRPQVCRTVWQEFIGDVGLATRRWRRRPVRALARRMFCEDDVLVTVSDNPVFW